MQKKYDKEMFSLVQENDRLKDKPLKTKQLTYFHTCQQHERMILLFCNTYLEKSYEIYKFYINN